MFFDPVTTPLLSSEDHETQSSRSNFEYLFCSDSDSESVKQTPCTYHTTDVDDVQDDL